MSWLGGGHAIRIHQLWGNPDGELRHLLLGAHRDGPSDGSCTNRWHRHQRSAGLWQHGDPGPPTVAHTGPASDPEEGADPAPASKPPCEEDLRLPFMEVEALDGPPDTGILTGQFGTA